MNTPLASTARLRLAGSWDDAPAQPRSRPTPPPGKGFEPAQARSLRVDAATISEAGKAASRALVSAARAEQPDRDGQHAQDDQPAQSARFARGHVDFGALARLQPGRAERRTTEARTPRADTPLRASDARWVLAVLCARRLEGGTAAILSPENRVCLLKAAASMGLRTFDATLIFSIVQDEARRGVRALSLDAQSKLTMVRPAPDENGAWRLRIAACATLLLAAGLAMALAAWFNA